MTDKENKRRCFKCGSSPAEDGVKLFRALKPGVRNLVRCEQWAQYMYPEKNVGSVEFLKQVYNEHRMLCSKHFRGEDFSDDSRKYLLRTAVPCDTEQQLPMYAPGPSQLLSTIPLRDVTNEQSITSQAQSVQVLEQASANLLSKSVSIDKPRPPSTSASTSQPGSASMHQPGPASTSASTSQPGSASMDQPGSASTCASTSQPGSASVDQPGSASTSASTSQPGTAPKDQQRLSKTEKEKILQAKCRKYLQKICQLQKRIETLSTKQVINALLVNKNVNKLCNKVTPAFGLLLQGQIRNTKRKLKGRRWSKSEKITALRIFKRSPSCYRLLRRLFALPSPSTLKNLLNKVPFEVGCYEAVFKVLQTYVKTLKPEDNEFILMFDEMSLKKHLNYNSKNDIIEGYQDHGAQGRADLIAGYALVFMIGGIRKKVKQPIAHYFSSSFCTADRLAALIKEVLHQCSKYGINIAATVCDMDSTNQRALSILGATIDNPFITLEKKEIVTMFDVPHLLKCFRNLFLKYDIEFNTSILSTGKTGRGVAKFSHIKQFYDIDNANPNFVFAPCLKKEHLNPNTKQKMKVNLAAQVLSHSVAAGMFAKVSDGTLPAAAAVTANLVANMDKLFDALNSDCPDLRRGKPHATNLTNTSPHKNIFAEMKAFFANMKFVGTARKPPSQDGWLWTINAVERLWRKLSSKHNIKSLATRRLQQDPLENLFGCIRGNCGSNTNPTCGQFLAGLKTAILSSLSHIGTTGNCERDNNVIINNLETLLSHSQPAHIPQAESTHSSILNESLATLAFEIDESLNENTAEIQACAYVCGFLAKSLPVNDCPLCKEIFLCKEIEDCHRFVESREYNDLKKSLTYVSKNAIFCVEFCASIVNTFFKENAFKKFIQKLTLENLRINVNFDFLNPCQEHSDRNKTIIMESVFLICVKRFCTKKNRLLAEEASASALKRKMDIILHK